MAKEKLVNSTMKLKQILNTETSETKTMLITFQKLIDNNQTVTPQEKSMAIQQFFDILKLVGLAVVVKFTWKIPFSSEAIYLLAKLLFKFTGINVLPSSMISEAKKYNINNYIHTMLMLHYKNPPGEHKVI